MISKLVVFITLFFNLIVYSQWQNDLRLTNDPFSSSLCDNNASAIATSSNILHVVWYDSRDGNPEIYYKRSTDIGLSWGSDTRLTNNASQSGRPTIAVNGSIIHIIWHDTRDGNNEIYYKRSLDAGVSWGSDFRLTNNSAMSLSPSIVSIGQLVHIVWFDDRDGNFEIYYKRSTNAGIDWGNDIRLTNDPATSLNSSIAAFGTKIHIVWDDNRGNTPQELYYKRSTDEGLSWGADIPLTNNSPGASYYPSVSVSGVNIHVVWEDFRSGDEIYYKRSSNEGLNWGTDIPLTNSSGLSSYPSIVASGSLVHATWWDDRDGNREIYYKRSTNTGIIWEAETRLTNNSGISQNVCIAVSETTVHTVWQDHRDGNGEIYYKRNPTGNLVGIRNIKSVAPKEFNLFQNYPNPFNPLTIIEFDIPRKGFIKLTIFDVLGQEITKLVNQDMIPGNYKIDWDASNYPSGVYFYKLETSDFNQTKKMILIK